MNNPQAIFWYLYDKYEEEFNKTFDRHSLCVLNKKALEMTVKDFANSTQIKNE